MKQAKSLCESCSNRVVIKYHNKESKHDKCECFFEFVKDKWDSKGIKRLDSIVDECTFHNKLIPYFKQSKDKKTKKQDSDTDDNYGTDSKGNRMYGVTFTNIPGALLP